MGYPVTRSFNTVKHSNRETRAKKRQKQRLLILAMLTVVMLLVLMLLIFAVCSIVNAVKGNDPDSGNAPPPTAMQFDLITRLSAESRSFGPLLLINDSNRFNAFSEVERNLVAFVPASEDGVPYYKTAASGMRLNRDALAAFNKMMAIYGDGKIKVSTAYRDYDTQAGLTSSSAAAPGHSDHHSGYLIAFADDGTLVGSTTFSNILENCHKYGFIVRYPTDKSGLTGIKNYSECLRYVGVAHASYIKQNNLCLEEYIDLVKNYSSDNQLAFYSPNRQSSYSVYYVPAAATQLTEIPVPQSYRYEISGNNVDGFVVAVYLDEKTA